MTPFTLKTYQQSALAALALFLRQPSTMGLEAAWSHAMGREGSGRAANKAGIPYRADELGQSLACACASPPAAAKH